MADVPSMANIAHAYRDGNLSAVGIVVLGAICSSLGVNAQKRSHTAEARLPAEEQRAYIFRLDWWLGFGGVALGAMADFWALGMASQSLVAAIGGSTVLLANSVFARFYNKEEIFRSDAAGIFSILLGVTVFSTTTHSSKQYTYQQLGHRFFSHQFLAYMSVQVLLWLILFATVGTSVMYKWRVDMTDTVMRPITRRVNNMDQRARIQIAALQDRIKRLEVELEVEEFARTSLRSPSVSLDVMDDPIGTHQNGYGATRSMTIVDDEDVLDLVPQEEALDHWMDQYIFAACSGTVGALSVLLASCTSKMLLNIMGGQMPDFWHPMTYFTAPALLFTVVLQTYLLNKALMIGDIMAIYPVMMAFWILFGVTGGVVFFQTGAVNLSGVALLVVGCYFMAQHEQHMQKKKVGADGGGAAAAGASSGAHGARVNAGEPRGALARVSSANNIRVGTPPARARGSSGGARSTPALGVLTETSEPNSPALATGEESQGLLRSGSSSVQVAPSGDDGSFDHPDGEVV